MYKYAFTRKVGLDLTIGSYHKVIPVVETIDVEHEQIVEENEELVETVIQDDDQVPLESTEAYSLEPFLQESQAVEVPVAEPQCDLVSQSIALNTATTVEDPVDKASNDLRAFIMTNLSVKVEELKGVLGQKIQAQEDVITAQLKRLDEGKSKGKK
jgi:hypothetical protein